MTGGNLFHYQIPRWRRRATIRHKQPCTVKVQGCKGISVNRSLGLTLLSLFCQKTEFSGSSVVLSVQTIECFETNVARFHGLCKHHTLVGSTIGETTLCHGLSPVFAVFADIDFIVFDETIVTFLTRHIDKSLHRLHSRRIKVYPVGELRHCHGVHGVPEGVGVFVDHQNRHHNFQPLGWTQRLR